MARRPIFLKVSAQACKAKEHLVFEAIIKFIVDQPLAAFLLASVIIITLFLIRRIRVPSVLFARVVYVCDGDTLHVRSFWHGKFKVRVAYIDAPESEQEDGDASQRWLEERVLKRRVRLVIRDLDFYGRYVAQVFVGETDMGLELLRAGWAWAYWPYLRNADVETKAQYRQAAEEAKRRRRGMWQRKDLIKPWDWRAAHRSLWTRVLFFFRRIWRRVRLAVK